MEAAQESRQGSSGWEATDPEHSSQLLSHILHTHIHSRPCPSWLQTSATLFPRQEVGSRTQAEPGRAGGLGLGEGASRGQREPHYPCCEACGWSSRQAAGRNRSSDSRRRRHQAALYGNLLMSQTLAPPTQSLSSCAAESGLGLKPWSKGLSLAWSPAGPHHRPHLSLPASGSAASCDTHTLTVPWVFPWLFLVTLPHLSSGLSSALSAAALSSSATGCQGVDLGPLQCGHWAARVAGACCPPYLPQLALAQPSVRTQEQAQGGLESCWPYMLPCDQTALSLLLGCLAATFQKDSVSCPQAEPLWPHP